MNDIKNAGKLLNYKFSGYFHDNYNHFHNRDPVSRQLSDDVAVGDEGHLYSRVWIGQILCKKTGQYYFHTNSDDSSIVAIAPAGTFIDYDKIKTGNTDHNILKNLHNNHTVDKYMVVNNKGLHGMRGIQGQTRLNKDTVYDIIVMFGENYGGAACIMHYRPWDNNSWSINLKHHHDHVIFAPYILTPMSEQEEKFQELKSSFENYYSQIDNLDNTAQQRLDMINDSVQVNLNSIEGNNKGLNKILLKQQNILEGIEKNNVSALQILARTKEHADEAKVNEAIVKSAEKAISDDIKRIEESSSLHVGTSVTPDVEGYQNIIEGNENICANPNSDNRWLCAISEKITKMIEKTPENNNNYLLLKRAQNEITEIMATKRNALSDIVFNYLMDPSNEMSNDNTFTDVVKKIQKDNQLKMRKIKINNDSINKNRNYLELLKVLVIAFILVIPLIIIRKNEFMPKNLNMALIILIIILVSIYSFYKVYYINNRDPHDYEKINHSSNVFGDKLISDGKLDKKDSLLKGMGLTCIGEECCEDGMLYDATLNKCKSVKETSESEGFSSMIQSGKYLDSVDNNIDPFKYFTDKYNNNNNNTNYRYNNNGVDLKYASVNTI